MLTLARIKHRIARMKAGRLARDQSGATMIEFGILALPFFAIIGATFEMALVFLASQVLDGSVGDASRLIRTGQTHTANFELADFRVAVCDHSFGLFNCDELQIKVHTLSEFADATYGLPVDEDGEWTIAEAYNHGGPSSIVYVEVYYKWPTVLNLFGFDLADQPDGTRLLASSRVFKNEPF
ncbi:MAG TPA: TadE/TadG family type IV pilus assembly protein [Devosiaceae bacterium]|nr:TadE/TadG family type IV pilus assembly protein [Devosiaceae bacterium]